MNPAAGLFATLLWANILAPSTAATPNPNFPLVATYREFANREISLKAINSVDKAFVQHRDGILKSGGKKLAQTDEGYGAKYRVRFVLKDGHVEIYSGVYDGWLNEWHFKPRSLQDALKLAQGYEMQNGSNALKIDFDHPNVKDRSKVQFFSPGDGCQSSYTFELDANGRCIGIVRSGAC